MLLHRIDVRTELVASIFKSDSNSTEMLIDGVPVNGSLNALTTCTCVRCRSRGVWHRPSELSSNAT